MATLNGKRSVIILYSGSSDIESHRARIVLAEKDVLFDMIETEQRDVNIDLRDINPYNTVPVLVDRELILYDTRVITEYLDERFPHPPLLPVYPVTRAKARLMIYRIQRDWFPLINKLEKGSDKDIEKARIGLTDSLVGIAPVFANSPFFLSNDFSLIDCCLAPILWRLPKYGIEIPEKANSILEYSERVFDRKGFKASLTESERELREPLD